MGDVVARASGATKRFGASAPVLSSVDLEIERGEVVGLVGPNGGGKSTLLLLLAGLIRPSDGTIDLDGLAAHEVAVAQSGQVGLITAEPGLYPLLTGRENLHFFAGLHGLSPGEADRCATPLLEELELTTTHLDRRSHTYSSGMRQKVSLVRALLLEPRLLLLDEPTSNLDPRASMCLHSAVRRQADAGVAVVLATHDLFSAEQICNRVVFVDNRVLAIDSLKRRGMPPARGQLYRRYEALIQR
jgi:ABC-type multidrug transport system ATPase subunit